ncbi:MAG: hypothetical protein QM715_00485 [Nibricoccus sp.]
MKIAPSLFLAFACAAFSLLPSMAEPEQPARVRYTGELTREFRLGPGEQAEGELVLQNPSATQSCSARIYQTDYQYAADGSAAYDAPGSTARSNAAWIEIDDHQPELKPGETRAIPFKITLPREVVLRGTYWSMIMVEPLSIEPASAAPGTMVVKSVIRYGIQIVVQAGNAEARPQFSRQQITTENGRRILHLDLANTGEYWLRPKMELRLFDGRGHAVAVLPGKTQHVFPGTSVRLLFDLATLAHGDYLALIVLDNGDQLFGAQYRFRIED